MAPEAAVFDGFEVEGPFTRFHFAWGEQRSTYRLEVAGDVPVAPAEPALAFRVGLALAPYFFSFLTPERLVVRAGALAASEAARCERW